MKKIFVLGFACFIFQLNAQENEKAKDFGFNQKDFFVTGGISFITTDSDTDGFSINERFGIGTSVGRFLTEHIAAGISAEFSAHNNGERTNNRYTAGVFGRYYATPENRFSLFGEFIASYANSEGITPSFASYGYSITIAPGINYFLNEAFALQARFGQLGYSYNKRKDSNEESSTFEFGLNFSNINFGLLYKF